MKKKEFNEIKSKTQEELVGKISTLREEISKLRFDIKLGRGKNKASMKTMKKDIARILMVLAMKKNESLKNAEEIADKKEVEVAA